MNLRRKCAFILSHVVFVKACETKHNVQNCCWHIWFNDGSKVFYATDMGNLNGITAPYYDLYLVEANYRDEEIQAKIAEKKVNGEYIYEKRVLRDHMSEQDAMAGTLEENTDEE